VICQPPVGERIQHPPTGDSRALPERPLCPVAPWALPWHKSAQHRA